MPIDTSIAQGTPREAAEQAEMHDATLEMLKEAQGALANSNVEQARPRGRVLIVHDDTPRAMRPVLAAAMAGIASAPIVIAGPPRKAPTLPKLTLGVDLPSIPRNRRERRALRAGR